MIEAVFLVSRQGKVRLTKFYDASLSKKEKQRLVREITTQILSRTQKMSNFVEFKGKKVVYKRYASLFFVCYVGADDNELMVLETIHHYVEVLDSLFSNVCELDIIFSFTQAYFALDEVVLGGDVQETSKREIVRVCMEQGDLMEDNDVRAGSTTASVR